MYCDLHLTVSSLTIFHNWAWESVEVQLQCHEASQPKRAEGVKRNAIKPVFNVKQVSLPG
jgi:hypothetical protein